MNRKQRDGIAGFVADVPFNDKHESFADLAQVASQLPNMEVPVRLWWGSQDPVFNDDFADDLMNRFADVQIQRVANGGHLAVLENSIAQFVETAISESRSIEPSVIDTSDSSETLWSRVMATSRKKKSWPFMMVQVSRR